MPFPTRADYEALIYGIHSHAIPVSMDPAICLQLRQRCADPLTGSCYCRARLRLSGLRVAGVKRQQGTNRLLGVCFSRCRAWMSGSLACATTTVLALDWRLLSACRTAWRSARARSRCSCSACWASSALTISPNSTTRPGRLALRMTACRSASPCSSRNVAGDTVTVPEIAARACKRLLNALIDVKTMTPTHKPRTPRFARRLCCIE